MTLPPEVRERRQRERANKEENRLRNTKWLQERGLLRCELCGYDRCYSCLEGHHLNPLEKENRYDSLGKWILLAFKSFYKKMTTHHIQILCRNCHREIESGFLVNNPTSCVEKDL